MTNTNKNTGKMAEFNKLTTLEKTLWRINNSLFLNHYELGEDYSKKDELMIIINNLNNRRTEIEQQISDVRKALYGRLLGSYVFGEEVYMRLEKFTKNGLKYAIYESINNQFNSIFVMDENGYMNDINTLAQHFLYNMKDPEYHKLPLAIQQYY